MCPFPPQYPHLTVVKVCYTKALNDISVISPATHPSCSFLPALLRLNLGIEIRMLQSDVSGRAPPEEDVQWHVGEVRQPPPFYKLPGSSVTAREIGGQHSSCCCRYGGGTHSGNRMWTHSRSVSLPDSCSKMCCSSFICCGVGATVSRHVSVHTTNANTAPHHENEEALKLRIRVLEGQLRREYQRRRSQEENFQVRLELLKSCLGTAEGAVRHKNDLFGCHRCGNNDICNTSEDCHSRDEVLESEDLDGSAPGPIRYGGLAQDTIELLDFCENIETSAAPPKIVKEHSVQRDVASPSTSEREGQTPVILFCEEGGVPQGVHMFPSLPSVTCSSADEHEVGGSANPIVEDHQLEELREVSVSCYGGEAALNNPEKSRVHPYCTSLSFSIPAFGINGVGETENVSDDQKSTSCEAVNPCGSGMLALTTQLLSAGEDVSSSAYSGCSASCSETLCNPNQFGNAVDPRGSRNRAWYVHTILRDVFEKLICDHPSLNPVWEKVHKSEATLTDAFLSNPSVLKLALSEAMYLNFRCHHNKPLLETFDAPFPRQLPPLSSENTDPGLLEAFSGNSFTWSGQRQMRRTDMARVTVHAPQFFNRMRRILNLNMAELRGALTDRCVWREVPSCGESGKSLIFFGNFVLKCLKESEFYLLKESFLLKYIHYCERNCMTTLPHFYALVTFSWVSSESCEHYILTQNVFRTPHFIQRIHVARGARVGLLSKAKSLSASWRTRFGEDVFRDDDPPPRLLTCGKLKRAQLLAQFISDTSFLASMNIVGYSCLIGMRMHNSAFTDCGYAEATSCNGEGHATGGGGGSIFDFDGGFLSEPLTAPGAEATTPWRYVCYIGLIDVLREYTSGMGLGRLTRGLFGDVQEGNEMQPSAYAEWLQGVLCNATM
ncbi:phosphatidylinositol-4-phosphate 5-kinase,putative [Trypanosoma brucei gambiense DAL972]|uniref:Phosphatidylinositol-4-phosphate 5-kinase,putative n=1 Tax=Trypanosoma brucei gambiense (strain MHOM/CI/86/DAL972) TaxID=679716 RepID=D0A2A4_TRYB9|nr:phosphatidylinositol-4-phosphate 5-kinase,putative [Trypanosoma brucei gambiense DAL972]CBH15398.1 phosphatidylinositol-4-phosphate 5-kinase,putative [Trypanosoma brucei gambiense DAL972]|eukprot:XP_011777662.1 phosphatidylinositol-4-phosphate 5-kinase,putative [Trypanosoma brucei gambiense DAL972]